MLLCLNLCCRCAENVLFGDGCGVCDVPIPISDTYLKYNVKVYLNTVLKNTFKGTFKAFN